MKIEIKPSQPKGILTAPASKSMAHRLLICAGLSEGESVIENVAYSQDILATLDCLEALGAKVVRNDTSVTVRGVNPINSAGSTYHCRESGSTLRFFIPLAMLSKEKSLFVGSERLMERPLELYEKLAMENGLFYSKNAEGITISGALSGGDFSLRGDISSQFVTGLLFALPFCENDSTITLTGKAESLSYIDMTIQAQKKFGVEIVKGDNNTFFIKGSQKYISQNLTVEGDFSNAAFLDAFNYLGSEIEVEGLDADSIQGDKVYKEYFERLIDGYAELDVSDCPDLAPILMTLACALNGARLTGTRRLKIKESDRGEVMKRELSKFGAEIIVNENEIIISKKSLHTPIAELYGHNDHRVVMSLSVLASRYGGVIEGAEAVNKSFPDFFEKLEKIGLEADEKW